ncbi:MAG TPA: glutamine-hydrolyzing carbamoyl-phosphate synthase small subunit [Luteibaculaceae bacterium]|nr:glutamine-hydrolyzing carbamoyl-phosphate synthase small subunit [Luteibaculaceae bacterium]
MELKETKKAILLLEDGTVFYGKSTGFEGTTTGEICFNTGMTGYQEIFTDPSYFGQIMVTATAHIGNYGVASDEVESQGLKIAGLVCKKFSRTFSRPLAVGSLGDAFKSEHMVGICDVDTRAVIRHIRHKGAMNALISTDEKSLDEFMIILKATPSMEGLELSSKVCTSAPYTAGDANSSIRVALIDYGVKKSIVSCLTDRGAFVTVFPMTAKVEEVLAIQPHGIMLSNGPGDPSVMTPQIDEIKKFVATGLPIFGICLGHQLLGLSQGLETIKMFNGHRGINHPIKNLISGKCEITSQNHGFVISRDSLAKNDAVELTHVHLNDNTVAGIALKGKPVFSVQYHPEASPGPHDSRYLFDQFINLIKTQQK